MSRAVILPTPGDPFLFNYWFSFYEKVWRLETDRLYIYVNGCGDNVWEYLKNRIGTNAIFRYNRNQTEHGTAIKNILPLVKEQNVMLIEDDGFIFKSGAVSACFSMLESGNYDIVGSKRGSCGTQILKLAQEKWGLQYDGLGDQGPNFWPCYFFTHTDLLRQISNYGARFWSKGEIIEPFGVEAEIDQAGDTFVEASLKLRGWIDKERIAIVPQNHLHPDDAENYKNRQGLWSGLTGWLHVGSLSSGFNNLLDVNKPLPPKPTDDFTKREYERRVAWWLRFYNHREADKIPEIADNYIEGIERVIVGLKLKRWRIDQLNTMIDEVLNGI